MGEQCPYCKGTDTNSNDSYDREWVCYCPARGYQRMVFLAGWYIERERERTERLRVAMENGATREERLAIVEQGRPWNIAGDHYRGMKRPPPDDAAGGEGT